MTTSLSVLHVTAPAPFGGLESVVAALGEGQRLAGAEVSVVAVLEPGEGGEDHPFVRSLADKGVPALVLEVPARSYLLERRLLRGLLDEFRPDVVHTHGFRPDLVDGGVARKAGVPVVATVHGFTGRNGWRIRIYEALQVRALRRFDAVVAVSAPLAQELESRGVPARRIHLHPNAWRPGAVPLDRAEARARLGLEPDRLQIGWVGRLSDEKGPDVLVQALAELADMSWTASFLGDGPLRTELEARVRALDLDGRVRWHGPIPEAGRYMEAFDLVAHSSRTEGTPIVLLEAMAAGRPMVATSVGGVPDLVGDAARLVPADDVEGLASAIRSLLGDPGARVELGEAARARLEEWADMERWVEGYRTIYERARNASNAGGRTP